MDKRQLVLQASAILSREGEDKGDLYDFQIISLIPAAIQRLATDIATGEKLPAAIQNSAQASAYNSGLDGNQVDTSFLRAEIIGTAALPMFPSNKAILGTLLSRPEPIILSLPFPNISIVGIDKDLIYLPDKSMLRYKLNPDNNQEEIPYYTVYKKEILIAYPEDLLQNSLEIEGYFIPSIFNVTPKLAPYLLQYLVAMFRGKI